MNNFFQLLKYKTLLFFRLEKEISLSRIIKDLGTFLVYASFTFGAYFFTLKSIEYALEEMKIGKFLLHEFLSIILFVFFTAVNIGNIVVSFSTMFKSSEVQHLFTKPISHRSIFSIKLLDNLFYSSSTLFLIMIAFFAGYLTYFNDNVEAIIFSLVFNFIPFVVISACLGVLLLMFMISASIKFGLKYVIISVSMLYILFIFLFFDQTSPRSIVYEVMKNYPNIDFYFINALPDFIRFMPNNWVSSSLYWNSVGNIELSILYSLFQFFVGIILFIITVSIGGKYYYPLWLKIPSISKSRSKKVNSKSIKKKNVSIKSIGLFRKDLILFIREPSQILHLIVFMILIIFFSASIESVNSIIPTDYDIRTIIFFSVQLFIILFITTLSLRFIFPLISLEGMSFWKIKSAPVKPVNVITQKYIPVQIFITTTAVILAIFTNKSYDGYIFWSITAILGLSSVLIGSLNFLLGSVFVMYNEKSPIRISSSKGASLTFLLSLFYMIFLIILLYEPTLISFREIQFNLHLRSNYFLYPVIIISILSFLSIAAVYAISTNSLKKDY